VEGTNVTAGDIFVTPITDMNSLPTSGGDYRLNNGGENPCVNAGYNTYIPSGVTTDLDGNPRIVGDTVDLGAYESDY
jgi:hypothetical protein